MTAIGGGSAVPASSTASRGGSKASRGGARGGGNSGKPKGAPRTASRTQKASAVTGVTKKTQVTQSQAPKPGSGGSGAA